MSSEFNEKNYSLKMDKTIQSFRKDGLIFLGRNHNVSEAIKAAESAKSIFPNREEWFS